jgi:predicted Zn-dependent protease
MGFRIGIPRRGRRGRYPIGGRRSLGGFGGLGKGRLLIALVMAAIAIGGYYFSGETNPFTGETDRVGNISYEQEVALGYNAAPEMLQQMGGQVDPNHPDAIFLRQIGEVLLDSGGVTKVLQEHNLPWQFTFTLIDDPNTVNAFALPGGPVFMTRALFDRLENEAQVAGVVGHEIGHVIRRHGAERMAQSQMHQQLANAAAVGTGSYEAGQIANYVSNFLQLSYGRDQELQSDTVGLKMMADAGYDPREMVRVMEILREASGGRGGGMEWAQTHPAPDSRIEAIKQWVIETYPNGLPPRLNSGRPLR